MDKPFWKQLREMAGPIDHPYEYSYMLREAANRLEAYHEALAVIAEGGDMPAVIAQQTIDIFDPIKCLPDRLT